MYLNISINNIFSKFINISMQFYNNTCSMNNMKKGLNVTWYPQKLDPFTMFPSYKTIGIKDSLPIIASHMSNFFLTISNVPILQNHWKNRFSSNHSKPHVQKKIWALFFFNVFIKFGHIPMIFIEWIWIGSLELNFIFLI